MNNKNKNASSFHKTEKECNSIHLAFFPHLLLTNSLYTQLRKGRVQEITIVLSRYSIYFNLSHWHAKKDLKLMGAPKITSYKTYFLQSIRKNEIH